MNFEDTIKGLIWGTALGDAVGLQAEAQTADEIKEKFPQGIEFPYSKFIVLKGGFDRGDWSDDTDQMILIMRSIINSSEYDIKKFALGLKEWRNAGFPELNDKGGLGLGSLVGHVISRNNFLENPIQAAEDSWIMTGRERAPNGAVMRTAILGVMLNCKQIVRDYCLTTHADSRCIASCLIICKIIQMIITNQLTFRKILRASCNIIQRYAPEYKDEWRQLILDVIQGKLVLDDRDTWGYTFKTTAVGIMAVRNIFAGGVDFKEQIVELIQLGGDTDTNAAVYGAILGAWLGYKKLPADWIRSTLHHGWLDKEIENFLIKIKN